MQFQLRKILLKQWRTRKDYRIFFSNVRSNAWKKLDSKLLESFRIPSSTMDRIKNALISAGIETNDGSFEADIFIVEHYSAVISQDSDYYCHKGPSIYFKFKFNSFTKNAKIIEFQIADMMNKLHLQQYQLLFLGVVNSNDYSKNLNGKGFLTNLKWLKNQSCNNFDLLIEKYCKDFNVPMYSSI